VEKKLDSGLGQKRKEKEEKKKGKRPNDFIRKKKFDFRRGKKVGYHGWRGRGGRPHHFSRGNSLRRGGRGVALRGEKEEVVSYLNKKRKGRSSPGGGKRDTIRAASLKRRERG